MSTPHPGPIIRALRTAAQLRQAELAARVGMTRPRLCAIEGGQERGRHHLSAIAAVFDVHVDVLTGHAPVIRALRERRGITIAELAAVAKVSVEHLADLEVGAELPDEITAQRIGRRLGINPAALSPTAAAAAA